MRAHQDLVFSTAIRITASEAQAQDVAQEVFIKAYDNFDQLRNNPSAGGWLRVVARNLSLNYAYRQKKRWRLFSELSEGDEDGEDFAANIAVPDAALDGASQRTRSELIERALMALPERQRVPLVLYHFEGMAYEEIAQHLNVSLAKVKVDIHRARAALVKILEQCGITADDVTT